MPMFLLVGGLFEKHGQKKKTTLTHKRSLKECCDPGKKGKRTVQVDIVAKSRKAQAILKNWALSEATYESLKLLETTVLCSIYFLTRPEGMR
jgi:hypothetical protein